MITDYTGASAVCSLIEQTGLTKFVIYRIGGSKTLPVFEHIEKGSCDKAQQIFNQWSRLSDNNLPYEMKLFNDKEDSIEAGETIRNKQFGKSLAFTFCLNNTPANSSQNNAPAQQHVDVNLAIENAVLKLQSKHNETMLMQKLDEMNKKIAELESDDDDDDDLGALNGTNPAMMNLLGLLSKALGGNSAPAKTIINGLDEAKIRNINKAVKILAKYDDEIDTDLLKLSSIAENNPDTFKMLISSLRNM